jgi:hypothetical protein
LPIKRKKKLLQLSYRSYTYYFEIYKLKNGRYVKTRADVYEEGDE